MVRQYFLLEKQEKSKNKEYVVVAVVLSEKQDKTYNEKFFKAKILAVSPVSPAAYPRRHYRCEKTFERVLGCSLTHPAAGGTPSPCSEVSGAFFSSSPALCCGRLSARG